MAKGFARADVAELARERSDSSYFSNAAAVSETCLCFHLDEIEEIRLLIWVILRKELLSGRLFFGDRGAQARWSEKS